MYITVWKSVIFTAFDTNCNAKRAGLSSLVKKKKMERDECKFFCQANRLKVCKGFNTCVCIQNDMNKCLWRCCCCVYFSTPGQSDAVLNIE